MVDLTAYRIQLQMILDHLQGHAGAATDEWPVQQQKRLKHARSFLRAASKCLGLVIDQDTDRTTIAPE